MFDVHLRKLEVYSLLPPRRWFQGWNFARVIQVLFPPEPSLQLLCSNFPGDKTFHLGGPFIKSQGVQMEVCYSGSKQLKKPQEVPETDVLEPLSPGLCKQ